MKATREVSIESMSAYRKFLKSDLWKEWERIETDQRKGIPPPPAQKPYPQDAKLVALVSRARGEPDGWKHAIDRSDKTSKKP